MLDAASAEVSPVASVTPKVAAIRAYTRAGFALIPLCSLTQEHEHEGKTCTKSRGKVPLSASWQKTKPGSHPEEELAAGNYGVALPQDVVVVDIDPRNFEKDDRPVARLVAAVGALESYTVTTGGGGAHIYFRIPAGFRISNSLKAYPGIEFKSAGRQVVGPGSVHPISGKEYVVTAGHIENLSAMPEALFALISRSRKDILEKPPAGLEACSDDDQSCSRYREYLEKSAPTSGSFAVACRGRDFGLTPETTLRLMLEIWNPRRLNPKSEEEFREKVNHAYRYAEGTLGALNPAADFSAVSASASRDLAKKPETPLVWQQNAQGGVLRTFNNLLNFLRSGESGLAGIFAFNELANRIDFATPAPWHNGKMPRFPAVTDTDIKLLKGYLASRYKFDVSVQSIEEAATNVAYHKKFHPVRDYLNGLCWDGAPRIDTWLTDHLGAEDSAYVRAVGRKVLCAAVMRAFHPGIKFDYVLVLEGGQDLGKSSVCEILGGDWASDAPVDPHSRDTVDAMQGRWIIEMAEMDVLRKVDEDALKAFITRRTDRCRLAYGRTTMDFPRQSIFIATKNPRADSTYLKDDTGNRRWWPIKCAGQGPLRQFDFGKLASARDQLFAEAVAACRTGGGEALHMETAELKASAWEAAELRHAEHEWTERIADWTEKCDAREETRRDFVTVREVWVDGMLGHEARLDQRAVRAITSILRNLGWQQCVKRLNGRVQRGWERRKKENA